MCSIERRIGGDRKIAQITDKNWILEEPEKEAAAVSKLESCDSV